MKYLSAVVCVMLAFSLSCTERAVTPVAPKPPDQPGEPTLRTVDQLTANESSLVASTNAFGLELFRRIVAAEPVDKNIFISPLSASYALAMAYNGANGTTREAMAQTLRINGMSVESADTAYQQLTRILMNTDPAVSFSIANAIWYRLGIPVHPSYVSTMQSFFSAKVKGLDFSLDASADTMNAWASENTNGKIPKVVDPPLDPNLVFMLMNAIYFKGAWTYPFDTANTSPFRFDCETGETLTVPMMTRQGQKDWQLYPGSEKDLLVYADSLITMISLPYGATQFQMAIISPRNDHYPPRPERLTSGQIVARLTPEQWQAWRQGLRSRDFILEMPRFRLGYDITMNDVLKAMGMEVAFGGSADFSNMITAQMGLYISYVKQSAFVQVDEKGTEAAAVTGVAITTAGPPIIDGTRPFIYIIYEKTSGTILFLGRLGKPEWKE